MKDDPVKSNKRSSKKVEIDLASIDAAIFDMDGVITDTARIHAASWEKMFNEFLESRSTETRTKFEPFDIDKDYNLYIDGKPRFDGVRSFLHSRGIDLPMGKPEDIDLRTVYGLGNRKNSYFLEVLKKEKIKVYESTVELIKTLKENGLKVAVISSSRNARAVLEAAGVLVLFDVKVDGLDSVKFGLKGKPEPDIFLEAARQLDVKPERAAILEDSLAGVEAGKKGNFYPVIGIDRASQSADLKKHGADVVVQDAALIVLRSRHTAIEKMHHLFELPSALDREEEIFQRIRTGTPVISLDYDGTLTPIVEDPARAILAENAKRVIERLSEQWTVAIISGRDLNDVCDMVGLSDIIYAGSHGFDITGPGGNYPSPSKAEDYLPELDKVEQELRDETQDISGAWVERKHFAVTIHYRKVADEQIPDFKQRVEKVQQRQHGLRFTTGKRVFEFLPDIDWNKGRALLSLYETLFVNRSRIVPFYIGDDVTDEDAFRAIGNKGITIVVGDDNRETGAYYRLKNPDEVRVFLEDLAAFGEREISKGVWTLAYEGFDPSREKLRETLCTTGNGYFATRGAVPESLADETHYPGTYVGGIYNRLKSNISGQELENESLVNVPNWLPLNFRIEDDDWFDVQNVKIVEYRQELDLKQGILQRLVRFEDEKGRLTRLSQRRFVHMKEKHLAGLEMNIVAENWSGNIQVCSALDGRVTNSGVDRYSQLNDKHLTPIETRTTDNETVYLQVETNQSRINISEAARTRIFQDGTTLAADRRTVTESGYIGQEFSLNLKSGKAVTIEKIVALFTLRDDAISETGLEARQALKYAGDFAELLEGHVLEWDHLWRRCRIFIEDDERTAMILHLHVFHLLQTVSPNTIDLDAGVPPRGLHGEAYRGHILWDELFIFPFLNFRIPDITRSLLLYRYRRLPAARRLASEAGYKGAIYPWQSGSNGREESQVLHLNPRSGRWIPDNSHLQRHVNIAIAYNIWLYYQVSGDLDFLFYYGAEMIIEIARFWASIAQYNRSLDRYEIRRVMGPDEYHDGYPGAKEPGIDNNAYTNIMAVWTLCRATEALDILPDIRREIIWEDLGLTRQEVNHWDEISRKMRLVFDADGIICQFEGYEKLLDLDWDAYSRKYGSIERLDRILELEGDTPNRYKLSKQADVLMLFYLLSADELREIFSRLNYPFDKDTIPKTIDFYMKRTSHGSTLSRLVHSWVLARSKREVSWHLFKNALESDVSDIQGGTTKEGIHVGAMAGTVDLIQRCYTGIETRDNKLWLNPSLPDELSEVQFDISYRQQRINLQIAGRTLKLYSRKYKVDPVILVFRDKTFELKPGDSLEFKLK